jgi:FAD binding domain in molybdopterin dehydrogenase
MSHRTPTGNAIAKPRIELVSVNLTVNGRVCSIRVLDAVVIVRGPTGQRSIQFTEFHRLPGSAPERDNVLERGDLILAIEVPARAERRGSHYLKVLIANPTNSRLYLWRRRWRPTTGAFDPQDSHWAESRTSPGVSQYQKARCATLRWTTAGALKSAIAKSFADAHPLATTPSRLNLLNAPLCAHCKPREHAHERHRRPDFTS